ncbi:MAG: hypothetical protein WAM60_13180 [Candidatus Promineifilaceae bacterium]
MEKKQSRKESKILPFWERINNWPSRRWLIFALIFMALIYGFAIGNNQSMVLPNGRLVFWLHDDMMISMRYGRNLVDGYGLVWNPGQPPVEGYSNFGWLLVMAAVHLFTIPDTLTSLVVLLINIFLAGLVLVLTARLAYRLVPKPGVWLLPALLTLVIIVDLARWTTIGLEVPLETAVFLWLLIRVLDEAKVEQPRASTFFLAGILGLIRVDGPLLAAVLCLVALGLQPNKRQILKYSPLILLLPAAHILFRLVYYGYPLPNTYYLKLTAWNDRLLPGLLYLLRFIRLYGLLLVAAIVGIYKSGDRLGRVLLLAGLPLAAYALFVGGDDFGGARFFAPWLPVLILLAFLTPHWLNWQVRPVSAAVLLVVLALGTGLLAGYRFYQGPGEEAVLAQVGLVLEDITWPNTSIGVFWAGTLPYFAHRPAVDLLGKNDAYVARLPANEGSRKPGHNKFDYEYALTEERPDLIVSPLSLTAVSDPQTFPGYTKGDDAYSGQLFLDKAYQQNYAPNLLIVHSIPIFIRSDSPERDRLLVGGDCEAVSNDELLNVGLETACWYDD